MTTTGSNGGPAPHADGADPRGRDADQPTEIPPTGWKDVLTRVRAEAKDDGVTLMAAGVAFYALLALVPGLVALISIYGLLAEPSDVTGAGDVHVVRGTRRGTRVGDRATRSDRCVGGR